MHAGSYSHSFSLTLLGDVTAHRDLEARLRSPVSAGEGVIAANTERRHRPVFCLAWRLVKPAVRRHRIRSCLCAIVTSTS